MPRQQPSDSFADLPFPTKGLDLSGPFGQQAPQTCPVGVNVRAYDVFEQRARGGSRPGLSRYVNDQVNGTALIQGLGCVVGVGYSAPGGTSSVAYVQSRGNNYGNSSSPQTLAYTSNVTAGNLLVVISAQGTDTSATVTVTDSLGNTYSQAGSYSTNTNPPPFGLRIGLFYCISASSGSCTVTVTPSALVGQNIDIFEYSGILASSPLTATSGNTGTSASPSTGSVTINAAGDLVIGGVLATLGTVTSSAFNQRTSHGTAGTADTTNAQATTSVTFSDTLSEAWTAIGASFKAATAASPAQSSQSGRIVTLVGVSGGTVKVLPAGGTAWGSVTSGSAALASSGVVRMSPLNQKMWFADGTSTKYYDPSTNAMTTWSATAGSLPGSSGHRWRLICSWRGAIVVSGIDTDPQNWFISAIGDPTNWNYAPTPFTSTAAVAGNNSPLGLIGNPMTALVPYSDDILIFGMDSSIYMLRGHPLAGGQLDRVSDAIGMAWGSPWAKDHFGNLYFFSNKNGIYLMTPGQTLPQRISQQIDSELASINTGANIITMLWDDLWQGLHIFISLAASASATTHYFWEQRTGAWWQDEFANKNFNPLCCTTFDGNLTTDRRSLIGSWDGYVRTFSETATTDDGYSIASEVVIGPLLTKEMDMVLFKDIQAGLATASGDVDWAVYAGATAEAALGTTPVASGTWSAGRNLTNPIRRSAHALWVRITSSDRWAMEGIRARIEGKGKVQRRGF